VRQALGQRVSIARVDSGWRAAGWREGLRRHGEECAQRGSAEGGGGGVMLSEGRERVDGADEGGELEAAGGGTRRGLELLRVAEPPAADPRGPAHGGCGEQGHSSQRSGGTERADGAGGGEESEAAGGGSRRGVELQEVGEQPIDVSGWGRDRVPFVATAKQGKTLVER
jgi:hypothetical protein